MLACHWLLPLEADMSQLDKIQNQSSQKFLSVPEIAGDRWDCDQKTVYTEIQAGRLRAVRIGKKILRVSLEELERYEKEYSSKNEAA